MMLSRPKAWTRDVLLTGALLACGDQTPQTLPPAGQVLVHVTTDAPLPPAFGTELAATDPPPLFDRLRIEFFLPGQTTACGGCTGEFALDRDLVKAGIASLGLVPPTQAAGYTARVTLFRSIAVQSDSPIEHAAVTSIVAIPPVQTEGIVDVGVTLRVDDVGSVQGSFTRPLPPTLGIPDYTIVGTWPGAQRRPCVTRPKAGEVCIPGGAFWMGDPTQGASTPQYDVSIPRLVVLSPFFLQSTEVTVATFRASKLADVDPTSGESTDPAETVNDGTLDVLERQCTYTSTPNVKGALPPDAGADAGDPPDGSILYRNTDALPVSCVTWVKATQYCNALGDDLPTEAQLEYVAGGLASQRHPWGTDDPQCGDAVFGRDQTPDAPCRPPGTLGAPLPPGSGSRDRLSISGGIVVDLVGNVGEWVRDQWNRTSEKCWAQSSLLHDPVCETPTVLDALPVIDSGVSSGDAGDGGPAPNSQYVVKLGDWSLSSAEDVRATRRFPASPFNYGPSFGFRCARSDR
jgi:formylglycine-generating enzyme required for sulfatase activity